MIYLSVIVPTYNGHKYIGECLLSLINQGFKHYEYEIIVINDASSDSTQAIIDSFKKQYSNIRSFTNKVKMGVSESRNTGINMARGKYITFCDSDDYLQSNIYSNLVCKMEDLGSSLFIFGYTSKYGSLDSFIDDIKLISSKNCLRGAVWRNIYLSKIIKDKCIRFQNVHFSEDLLFNYEYICNVTSLVGWTNRQYYFYRRHNNQTMNKIWNKKNEFWVDYFNSLRQVAIIIKTNDNNGCSDLKKHSLSLVMNGILWASIRFGANPLKTVKELGQNKLYLKDFSVSVTKASSLKARFQRLIEKGFKYKLFFILISLLYRITH